MRRILLIVSLAALVVSAANPARALAIGPVPVYPVDNFIASLDGPVRDVRDPASGTFDFNAGTYGGVRRVLQRYPGEFGNPDMDARHEAQVVLDSLAHMRPGLPHDHIGDVGHPGYTPDWDHDGVYRDGGGTQPKQSADFDYDTDQVMDTAYFLVPCLDISDPYPVHYRDVTGRCDVGDTNKAPYVAGVAQEVRFVNSRGLLLDATIWLPPQAFRGYGCPAPQSKAYEARVWKTCVTPANLTKSRLPAVVFASGIASRQEHYYWIAQRLAGEGYVVLTYDPSGQAESEGTTIDLFGGGTELKPEGCRYAGACLDMEDAVRWFTGSTITPIADSGPRVEARRDPAKNTPNPVRGVVDAKRFGVAGHSMGGAATLSYLRRVAAGKGTDGRPVPRPSAAVVFSYIAPTPPVVPVQLQTSDHDGLALGITPMQLSAGTPNAGGEGLGYTQMKGGYDAMRATPLRNPLSLVVLEGGSHTDFIDQPFIFRTLWANAVAGRYAQAWMDCFVKRVKAQCAAASAPYPHLSRSFASEIDTDGAGKLPSWCLQVPDQISLAQSPAGIAEAAANGAPAYDCAPRKPVKK
jgi:dienelactone hydrolase